MLVTAVGVRDGNDAPTFREYFQRLEELLDDSQSRLDAVDNPSEDESLSEEEVVEAVLAFFAAFPPVLRDLVDDLGDLTPPAGTEDAHRELVVADTELLVF